MADRSDRQSEIERMRDSLHPPDLKFTGIEYAVKKQYVEMCSESIRPVHVCVEGELTEWYEQHLWATLISLGWGDVGSTAYTTQKHCTGQTTP